MVKPHGRQIPSSRMPGSMPIACVRNLGIGWNPKNTLLVDDDPRKASRHPQNAIHPDAYDATKCKNSDEYNKDSELLHLITYLRECTAANDIQKHVAQVQYKSVFASH